VRTTLSGGVTPNGSCAPTETIRHWANLNRVTALEGRVTTLESDLAALSAALNQLTAYIRVDLTTINGLIGPHVIVEGANLHVRSGSGVTYDTTNLGNLIVGYNEVGGFLPPVRIGSHNLVVGMGHEYTASGGFVAGAANRVLANGASVSGGHANAASGSSASVSGGFLNEATGSSASVTGGVSNAATGNYASVSGGDFNTASGDRASVSGGQNRSATGDYDWVAGSLFEDF